MADPKSQPTEQNIAAPKKGFKDLLPKILLFGFIALNLATMGGSLFAIYTLKIAYHRPTINEESESKELTNDREIRTNNPIYYTFEPFTVNLDGRPRKLVRTTVHLEMLGEDGYEEAVNLTPVARDQIVKILNAKKYEDIETIQGKLFLKNQIATALNTILKRGSVKEVYFSDFVVQ